MKGHEKRESLSCLSRHSVAFVVQSLDEHTSIGLALGLIQPGHPVQARATLQREECMGKVIGYLRPDRATYGEKLVLQKLEQSLPADFDIYVECPLHDESLQRFPDFIVLSNFGVVVLEVKDWVQIVGADKFNARIRDRQGRVRRERNPVLVARDFATLLAQDLQRMPELLRDNRKLRVPWGYAAVLPNLPASVLTQLRRVWGDEFVLGKADLEHPVTSRRLKATVPRHAALKQWEIRCVRGVINPSVLIVHEDPEKPAVILDQEQEELVTEAPTITPTPEPAPKPTAEQRVLEPLAEPAAPHPTREELPDHIGEDVAFNAAIRLVRGVAGSGKTLVLARRAQYLAAQHPEWQIRVLTYNDKLSRVLRAQMRGFRNVKVSTFHRLCSTLLKPCLKWRDPCDPDGWLKYHLSEWPLAQKLGVEFLSNEFKWIKEVGIQNREAYLTAERKGRGTPLRSAQRERVYDILEAYQHWLAEQHALDWADVPHLVLDNIEHGQIRVENLDAILVDEAQDFAPVWIRVLRQLLKPQDGVLFLADDPSQSIYRFFSWREKGIPVVGRTRWLRIPYRNTREIYQAAYEVIREDAVLQGHLEEQLGTTLHEPDLASEYLRSGPRPELRHFRSPKDEFAFIRMEIERLLQKGYHAEEMVVLHRRRPGVRKLTEHLRGLDVDVSTLHALKGLEFEVVFLSQMQETFPFGLEAPEQHLSEERRLVYMAMTRARERLYLNYEGRWPPPLRAVLDHVDARPLAH
jgi:hypothetical protein